MEWSFRKPNKAIVIKYNIVFVKKKKKERKKEKEEEKSDIYIVTKSYA
jgi:hypothetical protein